jgi:hypothetical protein
MRKLKDREGIVYQGHQLRKWWRPDIWPQKRALSREGAATPFRGHLLS